VLRLFKHTFVDLIGAQKLFADCIVASFGPFGWWIEATFKFLEQECLRIRTTYNHVNYTDALYNLHQGVAPQTSRRSLFFFSQQLTNV
jgi:hypothetical protein